MIVLSNLEARGEMAQENKMLNRLKSIEGHVRGAQRMVEEEKYCIGILKQTLAVQRAIDKVNALILGNHLEISVTTAIRGDDPYEQEQVISELLDIFETSSKL